METIVKMTMCYCMVGPSMEITCKDDNVLLYGRSQYGNYL